MGGGGDGVVKKTKCRGKSEEKKPDRRIRYFSCISCQSLINIEKKKKKNSCLFELITFVFSPFFFHIFFFGSSTIHIDDVKQWVYLQLIVYFVVNEKVLMSFSRLLCFITLVFSFVGVNALVCREWCWFGSSDFSCHEDNVCTIVYIVSIDTSL